MQSWQSTPERIRSAKVSNGEYHNTAVYSCILTTTVIYVSLDIQVTSCYCDRAYLTEVHQSLLVLAAYGVRRRQVVLHDCLCTRQVTRRPRIQGS